MKTAVSSGTLIHAYHTIWCHNLEDQNANHQHHENIRCCIVKEFQICVKLCLHFVLFGSLWAAAVIHWVPLLLLSTHTLTHQLHHQRKPHKWMMIWTHLKVLEVYAVQCLVTMPTLPAMVQHSLADVWSMLSIALQTWMVQKNTSHLHRGPTDRYVGLR